jgi:hypothetical protein
MPQTIASTGSSGSVQSLLRRALKAVRIALLIQAPIWLVVALVMAVHTKIFLSHSLKAAGVIVENVRIQNGSGQAGGDAQTTFAPVFRFTAHDGQSYMVTSGTSTNPPSFAVGQQVTVLYLDGDPGGAKIDSIGQLWGFSIAFGIGSVATGAIGAVMLRYERRRRSRRTDLLAGT